MPERSRQVKRYLSTKEKFLLLTGWKKAAKIGANKALISQGFILALVVFSPKFLAAIKQGILQILRGNHNFNAHRFQKRGKVFIAPASVIT
jgi:hypothetical protein